MTLDLTTVRPSIDQKFFFTVQTTGACQHAAVTPGSKASNTSRSYDTPPEVDYDEISDELSASRPPREGTTSLTEKTDSGAASTLSSNYYFTLSLHQSQRSQVV